MASRRVLSRLRLLNPPAAFSSPRSPVPLSCPKPAGFLLSRAVQYATSPAAPTAQAPSSGPSGTITDDFTGASEIEQRHDGDEGHPFKRSKMAKNPIVFFDIVIGKARVGRIVMELFADVVPKTAENFRCLCTGEKGIGISGKSFHYEGFTSRELLFGSMCLGGDITRGDDTGGESIYGEKFDENLKARHTGFGTLSMVNCRPNTNQSQFSIFTEGEPNSSLYWNNVVFGKVVDGFNVVKLMEMKGVGPPGEIKTVVIENCGELTEAKDLASPSSVPSDVDYAKDDEYYFTVDANADSDCDSDSDAYSESDCDRDEFYYFSEDADGNPLMDFGICDSDDNDPVMVPLSINLDHGLICNPASFYAS